MSKIKNREPALAVLTRVINKPRSWTVWGSWDSQKRLYILSLMNEWVIPLLVIRISSCWKERGNDCVTHFSVLFCNHFRWRWKYQGYSSFPTKICCSKNLPCCPGNVRLSLCSCITESGLSNLIRNISLLIVFSNRGKSVFMSKVLSICFLALLYMPYELPFLLHSGSVLLSVSALI